MVRFAEGLVRIDIQNQVLFLLDNDAEGVDAYRKLKELNMSANLRSMVLPDVEELRRFPALGPEGLSNCDINAPRRDRMLSRFESARLPAAAGDLEQLQARDRIVARRIGAQGIL
ncbi:hypothetical protein HGG72_25025 [Ochrobactrum pecoris]|nr:hypothetical protein [Brucella pecoris]